VSDVYSLKSNVEVMLADGYKVVVRSFERSGGHALNTQDSSLVTVSGGVFRAAAIDGVTPTARTRHAFDVDGAIWAAGVARTILLGSSDSLETTAKRINSALHDTSIRNSRDQRQVTLAAAEVSAGVNSADQFSRTVGFLRAADCTAWAKRDGTWQEVFPGDAQVPETVTAVDNWCKAHEEDMFGEPRYAMEEEVSGRPENWVTAALGRFPKAKLQQARLTRVSEFVLASDGARLSPEDPSAAVNDESPLSGLDCTVIHVSL
jgi:hypothetical protein